MAHHDKAVELAKRFQLAAPADPSAAEVLGQAMFARSIGIGASERVRAFKETLAVYEAILVHDGKNSKSMRNVALCCKYLANALLADENYVTALDYAVRARNLDDARLAATPEDERTGPVFAPQSLRGGMARPTLHWASKVISAIGEKAGVKVHTNPDTGKVKYASAHDCRR